MKQLIINLNLTKESSLGDIEQALLDVPDFTANYYYIKEMACDGYIRASAEIFIHLNE